jgi:ketosteroid isomerase-like protein
MHPNAELLTRYYTSFSRGDAAGMWRCYAPDARFSDGIFTDVRGERLRAMWQMLCERAGDLEVRFSDIEADDRTGRAHWEATYTFQRTGRQVRNRVDASFHFQNGLIVEHRDSFSVRRWLSMAIGRKGALLGWTPQARAQVRREAERGLDDYLRGWKRSDGTVDS